MSRDFLDHRVSLNHPESAARLNAIVDALGVSTLWASVPVIEPEIVQLMSTITVHDKAYLERLEATITGGGTTIDSPDTEISVGSLTAALKMVGAGRQAVDDVLTGRTRSAFVLGRPPGHHAMPGYAMGFCLLSNLSLAAKHAMDSHGVDRVAIIDWDVHHGNGTQAIFYENERAQFISLHEHPLYPSTGAEDEIGSGDGRGYTQNYPLPAGTDDEAYLSLLGNNIADILQTYSPDLILISAGFDAHTDDPLGHMRISSEGFRQMTRQVMDVADEICDGRIVSFLEGGYNLDALAESVNLHLTELAKS